METESRLVVIRGWAEWEMRMTAYGTEFLFGVMKTFWNYIVVMVAQLCKYTI